MASFQSKLGRLPPMAGSAVPAALPAVSAPPLRAPAAARPSLDELRDRIARIVARAPVQPPRADPSRGELPFMMEHTDRGPLYVRRERVVPAARVGRVPLVGRGDADAAAAAGARSGDRRVRSEAGALPRHGDDGPGGGMGTVLFLLGLAWWDAESITYP